MSIGRVLRTDNTRDRSDGGDPGYESPLHLKSQSNLRRVARGSSPGGSHAFFTSIPTRKRASLPSSDRRPVYGRSPLAAGLRHGTATHVSANDAWGAGEPSTVFHKFHDYATFSSAANGFPV